MTQYYDLVMAETLSRYAKDALREAGLSPKGIAPPGAPEGERWAIAKEALYRQPIVAITEWGLIDFDPGAQKTLSGGETLTYDDYLDLMRKSGHSVRQDFEKAYYDASWCSFKGRVERINQKKGTVCFERIFISARLQAPGNGKMIDFGLRDPKDIRRIDEYELPSNDQLRLQAVDEIICSDLCMYNKHCNGFCIANQEWRESIRSTLLNAK